MRAIVASVVGFTENRGRRWVTCLGHVEAPARDDGYFLAISTAGADSYGGGRCVGGHASVEGAADMVRARWRFPGRSVCSFDGLYVRQ